MHYFFFSHQVFLSRCKFCRDKSNNTLHQWPYHGTSTNAIGFGVSNNQSVWLSSWRHSLFSFTVIVVVGGAINGNTEASSGMPQMAQPQSLLRKSQSHIPQPGKCSPDQYPQPRLIFRTSINTSGSEQLKPPPTDDHVSLTQRPNSDVGQHCPRQLDPILRSHGIGIRRPDAPSSAYAIEAAGGTEDAPNGAEAPDGSDKARDAGVETGSVVRFFDREEQEAE